MNELDLFTAALSIQDAQARAAFLDEHCQGNTPLRQRLEQLLKAYGQADQVLPEVPAIDPNVTEMFTGQKQDQLIGTLIAGKYKLLEEIGEGGMGTVFVAEQTEPVKRKVAVKLIKPGMDSKSVLARFEAERQALAMMDHPNIAKVLDAGLTDERRPYFVMEYIKGLPLTKYCDDVKLSIVERLKLFIQICQAVQHAHQKGIIHRDLKPTNILIALYDGKPVPKVIDFGLAKALHQSLTERTLHTGHEMVLGTPLYMSPEQAELNNLDIDTRSDIYSLGVILYELLTGVTPLEKQRFKEAAWAEVLRIIKEEEPSKPSTKLSHSESLPSVAAQRQMEPKKLSTLMKGDLDWIVMKALEKDRNRRYETANGFAADVTRFLSGEVVTAVPPSASYRLRRFVKRHQQSVAWVTAILLLLIVFSIFSTFLAVFAKRAEREAMLANAEMARNNAELQRQRDRAVAAERLASERLSAIADQRQIARNAESEKMDLATAMLAVPMMEELNKLGLNDPKRRNILGQLGSNYLAAGKLDQAIPIFEEVLKSTKSQFGPDHLNTLHNMNVLAKIYAADRKLDKALPLLEECHVKGKKYPTLHEVGATLLNVYVDLGKTEQATELANQLLEGRMHLPPNSSELAEDLAAISNTFLQKKKYVEAEPLLRECLTIQRKLLPDDWRTFKTMFMLGSALVGQSKYTEAEAMLLSGYEGMKQWEKTDPWLSVKHLPTSVDRLIQLYTETNNPEEVKKWQAEKAKLLKTSVPAVK